jgi:transcriptional antiterminator RfaH
MELENGHPTASAKLEWFCVRSRPKSEHIAASHLEDAGFDVFLPRIRFQKLTRRGRVWFTEALFPGYLFARFDRAISFRQVCAMNGVTTVVHFGDEWPTIPQETIDELRALFGAQCLREIAPELAPGDVVTIAAGPFQGLAAVVNQVLPAPQRVRVLLDFLGRQTSVEVNTGSVIPQGEPRAMALQPPKEEEDE